MYIIMFKANGKSEWEEVDSTEDYQESQFLLSEYLLAFRGQGQLKVREL